MKEKQRWKTSGSMDEKGSWGKNIFVMMREINMPQPYKIFTKYILVTSTPYFRKILR